MKKKTCFMLICLAALLLTACGGGQNAATDTGDKFTISPSQAANAQTGTPGPMLDSRNITVTFDYEKQSGYSSNQYAVWVEDSNGEHVHTLVATSFTADGGWKKREQALPGWVQSFGIADAEQSAIDAVSGATPASGKQSYTWACTDAAGNSLSQGVYNIIVEATLREDNRVLYKAEIDLAAGGQTLYPEPEFFGSSEAEREMLTNVEVVYLP